MTDSEPGLPPPPSFVSPLVVEVAKVLAAQNFIVNVSGGPKTGKSHFAFRSKRPLYLVYLDTNPNVYTHLLKSSALMGEEVYHLIIKAPEYKDLTEQGAKDILDQIEEFATWAKANARARVQQGLYGGTFVVDGMTFFKGYCEKAILGESVTLGFRPKKGETSGISTYDYAKSNGAVFEFISGFVGEALDACFVWEGRPVYKDVINSSGRTESKRTDAWKSTRPDRIPYAVNAEVEMLKALERMDPTNNQSPLLSVPKLRIVMNSENLGLDNMVIPAKTFDEFKEMLLVPTVGAEVMKQALPTAAIIRANDAGFPTTELVMDSDSDAGDE